MEKIFFFDLETTGVDIERSAIHQISYIIDINGKPVEVGSISLAPHEGALISDEALAIGNVTLEQISAYQSPAGAYKELISVLSKYVDKYNKLDKFTLCGFNNAKFDNDFLRAFFTRNKDNYFGSWFFSSTYDTMVMAAFMIGGARNSMEDFKLKTVYAHFGGIVNHAELHNASYDIAITRGLFYKIKERIFKRPASPVVYGGFNWVFFGDGRYSVLYKGVHVANILKCPFAIYVDMVYISEESFVAESDAAAHEFLLSSIAAWAGSANA